MEHLDLKTLIGVLLLLDFIATLLLICLIRTRGRYDDFPDPSTYVEQLRKAYEEG